MSFWLQCSNIFYFSNTLTFVVLLYVLKSKLSQIRVTMKTRGLTIRLTRRMKASLCSITYNRRLSFLKVIILITKNVIMSWCGHNTRIKKKPHPFVAEWKRHKKLIQNFFVQLILKIFEFYFILDQPQVCISNRLGDRACQSKPLFLQKYSFFNRIAKQKMTMYSFFLCHF